MSVTFSFPKNTATRSNKIKVVNNASPSNEISDHKTDNLPPQMFKFEDSYPLYKLAIKSQETDLQMFLRELWHQ